MRNHDQDNVERGRSDGRTSQHFGRGHEDDRLDREGTTSGGRRGARIDREPEYLHASIDRSYEGRGHESYYGADDESQRMAAMRSEQHRGSWQGGTSEGSWSDRGFAQGGGAGGGPSGGYAHDYYGGREPGEWSHEQPDREMGNKRGFATGEPGQRRENWANEQRGTDEYGRSRGLSSFDDDYGRGMGVRGSGDRRSRGNYEQDDNYGLSQRGGSRHGYDTSGWRDDDERGFGPGARGFGGGGGSGGGSRGYSGGGGYTGGWGENQRYGGGGRGDWELARGHDEERGGFSRGGNFDRVGGSRGNESERFGGRDERFDRMSASRGVSGRDSDRLSGRSRSGESEQWRGYDRGWRGQQHDEDYGHGMSGRRDFDSDRGHRRGGENDFGPAPRRGGIGYDDEYSRSGAASFREGDRDYDRGGRRGFSHGDPNQQRFSERGGMGHGRGMNQGQDEDQSTWHQGHRGWSDTHQRDLQDTWRRSGGNNRHR